ncbi:MAG: hypothetical protein H0V17_09140 [Deltaproteobacteria bacterium]|nr:hypothetical protein [Deltaproteobacteria bacterium]
MAKAPVKTKPPAAKPTAKAKPAKAKPAENPTTKIDPLLAQYWANPSDTELLRVWADALSERGDLRGEFIQLSLLAERTPEQEQRRRALDDKHHGKLAGPAREFLREFDLGPNGIVHAARCEADKLVAGLAAIEWINPRLALKVTSLKSKPVLDELAKLSLERIYHVSFQWNVIGSQGGSPMTDAQLIKLAPAFRRVRHLSLDCGGYLDNCFTPEGLRVLGNTVEQLEFLSINYYNSAAGNYPAAKRRALPPMQDYAHAIATTPGFRTLKTVFLRANNTGSVSPEAFASLPSLVYAETTPRLKTGGWPYGSPGLADEIDAAKRGERHA